MKVLGRNYETWDNNQMDLKIISFNLNENERERVSTAAFGVCAMRRILRVSYTFEHTFWGGVLYHLSVSFHPVPESTYEGWVRVVGSFRFLLCDLIWLHRFLNDIFVSFRIWAGGYSTWECSIVCGASYHVWDLSSVLICDDVAKDPSDRLSPLTSAKSYFSELQYSARYVPANIPWPMTVHSS